MLFILAAVTGLYASLIQKYTMDWEFLRASQEKMKKLQRNMKEAQLSGDQSRIQAMQNEQMKAVADQGKMMQMQFKPMLYIGIVSIPLFMWAYRIHIRKPKHDDDLSLLGDASHQYHCPGTDPLLVLLVLYLLSACIAGHS